MFNSKNSRQKVEGQENGDVAKLFFDTFSKRVASVEESIRLLGLDIAKAKIATERSQVSDLVLLERIQHAEGLLEESLSWTKRLIEIMTSLPSAGVGKDLIQPSPAFLESQVPAKPLVSPMGESGSLSAITTPTELQVLTLLAERGPMSAPEIGRSVGRSREHTARLMKSLFEQGYLKRDQSRVPFRYSLSERVRQTFVKPIQADQASKQETAASSEGSEAIVPPPV